VIADARAASLVLLWLGDAIIAAAQDQNTDGRRRRECHCRVCCLAGRCLQLLILALPLRRPLPAIMSAENRTPHRDVDHGRDPSAASREPEISAAVAGRPSSRCRIGTGWRAGRSPFGAPRPNWHIALPLLIWRTARRRHSQERRGPPAETGQRWCTSPSKYLPRKLEPV